MPKTNLTYLAIVWLCLPFTLFAQRTLTGTVMDADEQPLEFANVLLLKAADSLLVRGAVTNEAGVFLFENVQPGSYLVSANMVGFGTTYSEAIPITDAADLILDPIVLSKGLTMDEIEIVADKPLYEQKVDRLIVNVESSVVSAGATALEVLERSPGVLVDRFNSSISLLGKNGVQVMINDKITYMPISTLIQFLEGMPADNIKTIELITTPPANLDAEGNAGYINIVVKKRTDEGLNGSYSLSYGYGRGHVSNDNLALNFRRGRVNLFGNYSFSLNQREQLFASSTTYRTENVLENSQTSTDREPTQRNHNVRLGVDYQVSPKTLIGGLFSAFDNKWTMDALNVNNISRNNSLLIRNAIENEERNQQQNLSGNLNLKHQFTPASSLSFDLDYLAYRNENPTDYENRITDGSNQFLGQQLIRSDKETPIHIFVTSTDFEKSWGDKFHLMAGGKIIQSRFDNDVTVDIQEGNQPWMTDPQLTNFSELDENIYAGYVSTDFPLGPNTQAQVGLRYEFTDSKLDSREEGILVDREFGRLFPTVYLNHTFNDNWSANLSYARRITRPTFRDMAPFVYFIDLNNFFAGNPAIQPSIADAYKLDLRYKSMFFSVQYTFQDSTIANFQQRFDPETNRLIWLAENLSDSRTLSFTVGFPLTVTPWWQMRNNAIYFRQQNNSFLDGSPISIGRDYLQVNTTQSFTISKRFSGEASLMYTGPSLRGTQLYSAMVMVNTGLNINLGEQWDNLRLNVNDVFNSFEWNVESLVDTDDYQFEGLFDFSQTTFVVSYQRSFGNQQVKAARKRQTGAEEVKRRAN